MIIELGKKYGSFISVAYHGISGIEIECPHFSWINLRNKKLIFVCLMCECDEYCGHSCIIKYKDKYYILNTSYDIIKDIEKFGHKT